jgi:uncharacterized protein (DUF1499 family)
MKIVMIIAIGLLVLIGLVSAVFVGLGADRFWRLFGPPDLGPMAFEQLIRRTTPNDALACPTGLCTAKVEITTPVYPVAAAELRRALATVIASEPQITIVETADASLTDRYIQRSARMGFPDTIVVRFLERPEGRSTLAIYSRSQFGESDLGVNRARIERWLAKLAKITPPIG